MKFYRITNLITKKQGHSKTISGLADAFNLSPSTLQSTKHRKGIPFVYKHFFIEEFEMH
jgi:hypothetical protein